MPANKSKFLVPVVGAAFVAGGVAAYLYFKGTGDASSPLASAKVCQMKLWWRLLLPGFSYQ